MKEVQDAEVLYNKFANAILSLLTLTVEAISDSNIEKVVNQVLSSSEFGKQLNKEVLIEKVKEKTSVIPFKPRARLLLQLGDQLIKNENIALLELIKNSYDADASHVNVYLENVENPNFGTIFIEDDGFGMNKETVVNVWMEPGSDSKSKLYQNRELTPRFKRLPIGEKGIGRFGVHKLGHHIELITKKEGCKEVHVEIDWTIFESKRYLDEIPIEIKEVDIPSYFKNGKTGTFLKITNLRKTWTRGMARDTSRAILSLMSPFDTTDKFRVDYQIIDKPEWLNGLLTFESVKDFSLFSFDATIENDAVTDFHYNFTPWTTMNGIDGREEDISHELVSQNVGLYYKDNRKEIPFSLKNEKIGQVRIKGYVFDQDTNILKLGLQEGLNDRQGFKSYLKSNGGIRVFRDGLRIYDYGEPGDDWLGLDIRRVNSPVKKLSNNILFGAVYLDRAGSDGLIEKTNREGFVENSAYQKFQNSILHVLSIVETLRQTDKVRLRELYSPTTKSEPVLHALNELRIFVDEKIEGDNNKRIKNYISKIEADYKTINDNLLKAAGAGLSMSVVIHEVEKIILEVEKVLKKEKASEKAINLITHLTDLVDGYSHIIRRSTIKSEDIIKVVDQGIFNTSYRLKAHKITIIKKYKDRKPVDVKLSKSLITGCLMNIVDNSIYWVTKAKLTNCKMFVDIISNETNITVLIADNGPGFNIPTDVITKPFVSGKIDGMGLGLHIASEIMHALNGELIFPEFNDYEIPIDFKQGAIIGLKFKN